MNAEELMTRKIEFVVKMADETLVRINLEEFMELDLCSSTIESRM